MWAALTFVRQIKGVDCCIRVLHVGGALIASVLRCRSYSKCTGTIRKTQQEAIKHDRRIILAAADADYILPSEIKDLSLLKRIDMSKQAIMAIES